MTLNNYNRKNSYNYYKESEKINEAIGENRLFKLINSSLKNKKVLDAGCGFGYDCNLLYHRGAKVFGIDTSSHLIKIAKGKYPHLSSSLKINSTEKLPFKNNYFDIIISKYVLHYLKNPDLAFREFSRCLKKNGTLLFSVHHPISAYFFKKNKDYLKKEKFHVSILKGVTVAQISHTFTDYFSKYFLDNFILDYIEEGRGNIILSPELNIPEYLIIKATKK